jgi:hypothetical protein
MVGGTEESIFFAEHSTTLWKTQTVKIDLSNLAPTSQYESSMASTLWMAQATKNRFNQPSTYYMSKRVYHNKQFNTVRTIN